MTLKGHIVDVGVDAGYCREISLTLTLMQDFEEGKN